MSCDAHLLEASALHRHTPQAREPLLILAPRLGPDNHRAGAHHFDLEALDFGWGRVGEGVERAALDCGLDFSHSRQEEGALAGLFDRRSAAADPDLGPLEGALVAVEAEGPRVLVLAIRLAQLPAAAASSQ